MAERATRDLAVVVLNQQRTALLASLDEAGSAFKDPIASSPRAKDATWIRAQPKAVGLEGIFGVGAEAVVEILRVTAEHATALRVLLSAAEILPIPAVALSRSIYEGFVTASWCVDPELETHERLVRLAVLALASSQGTHRALIQLPDPPESEVSRVREGMVGMQGYLTDHHFKLKYHGGNASAYAASVEYGGRVENLKIDITAAGAKYMSGNQHLWTVGSGAAHSRNWFTSGMQGSRGDLAVMVVAPLLDICDSLMDHVSGYVGTDPHDFHVKAHGRRIALLVRTSGSVSGPHNAPYEVYAARR